MTLATLARDRRAPRAALPVLVVLVAEGWVGHEWRRLKHLAVASAANRMRGQTSAALAWLVQQGYLERRDDPFIGALYRLPQR